MICYLYHVHLTAEHIYLKQKKSKFTRLLHKITLAHPGYEKEKLCQTISFILLLHINVITSSYHTRLQQRWDDKNTMPFITSSQSKIGEITLNNYIKTRAPRTEWICIELNPLCVCTCIYFCVMFYKCTFIALAFVPWIF